VLKGIGQCGGTPPPPGYDNIYALDTNNDGYASFDIDYYINYIDRPFQENAFAVSASGYDFVFENSNYVVSPSPYTNIILNEYGYIYHNYTGTGPTFEPQPPCYWPLYDVTTLRMVAVPYNQDMDGDGILNADEDTNHNLNLMDDDDDHDGIINLKDATNSLAIQENRNVTLTLYPNPITNGTLTFESNAVISAVTLYDVSGKEVLNTPILSNTVKVDALATGIYFIKFQAENTSVFRKIVVN
jgi:hypothetical protein